MATAVEQAKRNEEIVAAHAAGGSVAALALRFGLSPSRIKQVLRDGPSRVAGDANAMQLAESRRAEYRELVDEVRALAADLPLTQASSKVGAYKVAFEGLDRLTALERALGLLPDDLSQLGDQRDLAEAVLAVFVEFNVPDQARQAVVERLGVGEAAP